MFADVDPNDYQLNGKQRHIRVSMMVMFAVSAVSVALRVFVRTRLQSQFSSDDWLLLVALAGYLVMTVMIVMSINEGGFGRKTAELAAETFRTGAKFLVLSQVSYVVTMMTTKLSIALLQLRIIGKTSVTMRRITFVSIAVNVIIATYEFFAFLFQCTPPRKYWTPSISTGHCADRMGVAIGVYVYSGVNLLLDWYYALALAPMVWKLQMRIMVKVSTMFVLGLGVLASVANIIRFQSLIGYATKTDTLYIFIPIATRTWAEMCLAIVATSMATFRPLVRLLPWAQPSHNSSNKYPADNQSPFATWRTRGRTRDPMQLSDMDLTTETVHDLEEGGGGGGQSRRADGPYNSTGDAESQKYILREVELEVRSERRLTT